jgi:hypothetical protein
MFMSQDGDCGRCVGTFEHGQMINHSEFFTFAYRFMFLCTRWILTMRQLCRNINRSSEWIDLGPVGLDTRRRDRWSCCP